MITPIHGQNNPFIPQKNTNIHPQKFVNSRDSLFFASAGAQKGICQRLGDWFSSILQAIMSCFGCAKKKPEIVVDPIRVGGSPNPAAEERDRVAPVEYVSEQPNPAAEDHARVADANIPEAERNERVPEAAPGEHAPENPALNAEERVRVADANIAEAERADAAAALEVENAQRTIPAAITASRLASAQYLVAMAALVPLYQDEPDLPEDQRNERLRLHEQGRRDLAATKLVMLEAFRILKDDVDFHQYNPARDRFKRLVLPRNRPQRPATREEIQNAFRELDLNRNAHLRAYEAYFIARRNYQDTLIRILEANGVVNRETLNQEMTQILQSEVLADVNETRAWEAFFVAFQNDMQNDPANREELDRPYTFAFQAFLEAEIPRKNFLQMQMEAIQLNHTAFLEIKEPTTPAGAPNNYRPANVQEARRNIINTIRPLFFRNDQPDQPQVEILDHIEPAGVQEAQGRLQQAIAVIIAAQGRCLEALRQRAETRARLDAAREVRRQIQ